MDVGSARQLLSEGRLTAAIARLSSVLQDEPEHREALYLLAVCRRYGSDTGRALEAQDELLKRHPQYARGYQERGHLYRDLGHASEAVAAYERAVALNPGLLASWVELAKLHEAQDRAERAAACAEKVRELRELPRELMSALSMVHEGRLQEAERLCREYLRINPRHVEGLRLLAKIAGSFGVLDEAQILLQDALTLAPEYQAARFEHAQVLHRGQRFREAREQAEALLAQEPDNPAFEFLSANAAAALGEFDRALDIYDHLIVRYPHQAPLFVLKGHALKSLGRRQGAVEAYRAAVAIRPDFGDAWWSLANLKTYRFEMTEILQMRRVEAEVTSDGPDRCQLCFALGKALEDHGDYRSSFDYYARGNALKMAESGYRPEWTEKEFEWQQAICTQELFAARAGYGLGTSEPVFIVGMPRSGSTLLEQILASHPMVEGTIELPDIISLVRRLDGCRSSTGGPGYPAVLKTLTREQCERFGSEYLESTRVYRRGAPFFTDKTPNNFRHIGLIHLLFPNARIIDARREPMACCFSNFKQLFGEGQYFSYGLEEVGRYYRGYVSLMSHWERVLPGKILRVQYEEVVADLEAQVRRLLDFLKLPFDWRCIRFHENERAVHTPSADQVRRPLYREQIEQWRNFEPFLEPLKRALGIASTGPDTPT